MEIKVFAGQQFDVETGLYHLRATSYDPATGRFTQRDPAGPMAGAAHESSYLYAAGAPMRWVDPTGLRIAEAEQREQLAQSNLWKTNPLAAATEALKDPHVFLDVAGFIPVIGIVADAANAALYALEGDWANAAISAVAMIPAAGSVLAAGLRYSDEALAVGRLARHSDEVASAGRTVAKNFDEGIDLSGVGLKHGDEVGGVCRANSFLPSTRVLMADGSSQPIEDVDVGDLVWAADPETGEFGPRRVTDLIVGSGSKDLVEITIDGETITATDGHPFWVDDEGAWVDAEDLEVGDNLLVDSGDTVEVDAIFEETRVQRVHNLTVEGIHTYYVLAGDDAVLVHNCKQHQLFDTTNYDHVPESAPRPQGRGSTGRTSPSSLKEQLAMSEVRSFPGGTTTRIRMGDPRWPGADGWVKRSQTENEIQIHYVQNGSLVDDFKFKDPPVPKYDLDQLKLPFP